MKVTVTNGDAPPTEYVGISALGIGHLRKDVALVPNLTEHLKVIAIEPNEWTALSVVKEDA